MKPLEVHCDVRAPREIVFDVATDLDHWPEHISAIEKIERVSGDGFAVGTVFTETRRMFGREASETMTVAELEAPERFLLTADSHGSKYRSEFRIDEFGDGSRLTLSFEALPQTFMAKLMGFLMKPMIKKMANLCAQDLQDLKAVAETRASQSRGAEESATR